jgi:hypothetical protein
MYLSDDLLPAPLIVPSEAWLQFLLRAASRRVRPHRGPACRAPPVSGRLLQQVLCSDRLLSGAVRVARA